jgi:hypothetical protein
VKHAVRLRIVMILTFAMPAGMRAQVVVAPVTLGGQVATPRTPIRSAAECVGIVGPVDGMPGDSIYHPPEPKEITVPPFDQLPDAMRGRTFAVRFLVNTSGAPDSIEILGMVGARSDARIRKYLMTYRFRPATYRGCTVRGWAAISMTRAREGGQPERFPGTEIIGSGWPAMPTAPWSAPLRGAAPEVPPAPAVPSSCARFLPRFSRGEWPDAAVARGAGQVVLRFVIDSTGVPVDSTVRVIQTSGPRFTAEVHRVFSSLRFDPAWCGAGPAAVDVQQLFLFVR